MHHTGTCTLSTQQLVLRPFVLDDAPAMFEGWAGQPESARFLRWQPHRDWSQTAEVIWYWTTLYGQPDFYQWAITDRLTGALLGSTSLYQGENRAADWQLLSPAAEAASWELGLCLGKDARGRGLGPEVLHTVARHWLDTVGADFLGACCREDNGPARRILTREGFVYDHTLTGRDGEPACRIYGIVKEEKP